MAACSEPSQFPELIFGIAGPIGVDIDAIASCLTEHLRRVRYDSEVIRLTATVASFPSGVDVPPQPDYFALMKYKIEHGNSLCSRYDPAFFARIAIDEIRKRRRAHVPAGSPAPLVGGAAPSDSVPANEPATRDQTPAADAPLPDPLPERLAYIIRQFKRPAEIELMRRVYGRQFILLSAYGSAEARKARLEDKIKGSVSTLLRASDVSSHAEKLMERDASEDDDQSGQQLRDTFHLADVFVDGIDFQKMNAKVERFINALFGKTDITPSKAEYGMYAAKSASLRSADLSRQVGAAIFTGDGELIAQGCNEVPKALGGTYWDLEEPDFRDVKLGRDPNHNERQQILRDLFERLMMGGLLSDAAMAIGSPAEIVARLTTKSRASEAKPHEGSLTGARVMDLTEFGRVVHAEMCAICDAARLGRSIKGATLFCTTFPCHNCAKHIIAAGIKTVVFMEPYPKSPTRNSC
ncbi:MAG TPA: anti-phage dCTP deaminase [Mesorhizobium sp.]|jgi:cytidine deaminase|nr:anti-phage dCTP deaminase [Mesorhizobium sp.]